MGDRAPLLDIPEAPVPRGGEARWVRAPDGVRLRTAWFPHDAARGTVLLSPGRTEPIEKHFEVVDDLRARGFAVAAHDWRGQGLCDRPLGDPLKGHAKGWRAYVADVTRWLDGLEGAAPRPWIAVGHSMGGCLTLLALTEGERRLDGAVLSAPMLKLKKLPAPARALAWAFSRVGRAGDYVFGGRDDPRAHAFDTHALTTDAKRYARWRAQLAACPEMSLGGVTWGWLDFAFTANKRLRQGRWLEGVAVPVTLVAAGAETLIDNAGTREIAARLPHGRYVEVADARHEILIETDAKRSQWFAEFDRLADSLTPPQRA